MRSVAPEARIRILVATGFHRPSTHAELVAKYGEEIVANEEIVMHKSQVDEDMVKIGKLPSGGDLIIN
ncbi:lactate racemase domain-containing protein, partial [Mycobacterium kansasii]